jgi:hypothetical protein
MWLKSMFDPLYRWLTDYMGACGFILYGGGGGGAPPPDPRLIEAQIKNLGIQDGAIQGILNLQREMQPLIKEEMQFGLDESRTAFKQAQDDREYALGRRGVLTGLQDRMTSEADNFNAQVRGDQLAARAGADVTQAFANVQGQNARNMARMGINPNSGRADAINRQTSIAQAAAMAGASNSARESGRSESYALTDRASNALAGYPAMGMQATGAGAQYSSMGLNIANQGMAGMSSGFNQAGSMAAQAGTGAGNMWGQQSGAYQAGQDRKAEGQGAMLGAGVTIAAAFI